MGKEEEVKQEEAEEPEKKAKSVGVPKDKPWNQFVERISYKGIVNNIPYMLFLTLLAIIYIGNSNHAIDLVRELTKQKKELKELRWKYMDLEAQLMSATTESKLEESANKIGLESLKEPVFEIKVK